MNKRFVRTLSRTVDNAVLLTLLVILVLAAYSLWDSHQVFAEADAEKYETYKPVAEEDTKSFDELRAMNPDVLGWITIYDTKIDYPLVQSKTSNSEYLSRNPEKEFQWHQTPYSHPIPRMRLTIMNNDPILRTLVQTTSCPASPASASISLAMMAAAVASGDPSTEMSIATIGGVIVMIPARSAKYMIVKPMTGAETRRRMIPPTSSFI